MASFAALYRALYRESRSLPPVLKQAVRWIAAAEFRGETQPFPDALQSAGIVSQGPFQTAETFVRDSVLHVRQAAAGCPWAGANLVALAFGHHGPLATVKSQHLRALHKTPGEQQMRRNRHAIAAGVPPVQLSLTPLTLPGIFARKVCLHRHPHLPPALAAVMSAVQLQHIWHAHTTGRALPPQTAAVLAACGVELSDVPGLLAAAGRAALEGTPRHLHAAVQAAFPPAAVCRGYSASQGEAQPRHTGTPPTTPTPFTQRRLDGVRVSVHFNSPKEAADAVQQAWDTCFPPATHHTHLPDIHALTLAAIPAIPSSQHALLDAYTARWLGEGYGRVPLHAYWDGERYLHRHAAFDAVVDLGHGAKQHRWFSQKGSAAWITRLWVERATALVGQVAGTAAPYVPLPLRPLASWPAEWLAAHSPGACTTHLVLRQPKAKGGGRRGWCVGGETPPPLPPSSTPLQTGTSWILPRDDWQPEARVTGGGAPLPPHSRWPRVHPSKGRVRRMVKWLRHASMRLPRGTIGSMRWWGVAAGGGVHGAPDPPPGSPTPLIHPPHPPHPPPEK